MGNPTKEQQYEPGYTTRHTSDGREWWTLDGIDWFPLKTTYHDDEKEARIDELNRLKESDHYPFHSDEAEDYVTNRLRELKGEDRK